MVFKPGPGGEEEFTKSKSKLQRETEGTCLLFKADAGLSEPFSVFPDLGYVGLQDQPVTVQGHLLHFVEVERQACQNNCESNNQYTQS